MSDALRPGEIDLEAAAPAATAAPPAAEPAAAETTEPAATEPATDTVAAPATDETAPTTSEDSPGRRPASGMLAELIAERQARKTAETRLREFEGNPVLQRLTPEVQQAILEGRLQIQPPQGTRDAEQARLQEVAETLQLYKVDAQGQTIPDLDAARRVSQFVRTEVQAEVAPVRHMGLAEKAQANVDKAVAYAEQHGLDVDIVKDEFLSILTQPNGAELLAQGKIAKQVWRVAVGRMHEEGKLTAREAKKAVEKPPAAVITEPTGRRASAAAAVTLSPALQRVYQEHGLKPEKAFSATRQIDLGGPIDLE